MVSVSGLRGRVGDGLTPEVVAHYAAAFGAYVRQRGPGQTVVLGRDSRVSGPMFARAVTAALQSVGCDVVDVGTIFKLPDEVGSGLVMVEDSHRAN